MGQHSVLCALQDSGHNTVLTDMKGQHVLVEHCKKIVVLSKGRLSFYAYTTPEYFLWRISCIILLIKTYEEYLHLSEP